jgi:hypothetical protein
MVESMARNFYRPIRAPADRSSIALEDMDRPIPVAAPN